MRNFIGTFFILCVLILSTFSLNASDALLKAVEEADLAKVELLLETQKHLDIDQRFFEQRQFSLPLDSHTSFIVENFTVLHIAAGWGDPQMVRLLLAHGASATIKDKNGISPLDIPWLFLLKENTRRKYIECRCLLQAKSLHGG